MQASFTCCLRRSRHLRFSALIPWRTPEAIGKHRTLSWAHANKIEAQLRQQVQTLFALADKSDRAAEPDGMDVPAEIARREDRLNAIVQANAQIEQRRLERYKAAQQFEAKQAKRCAQRAADDGCARTEGSPDVHAGRQDLVACWRQRGSTAQGTVKDPVAAASAHP